LIIAISANDAYQTTGVNNGGLNGNGVISPAYSYTYLRRMSSAQPSCNALSTVRAGGSITFTIDGQTTTPGQQLTNLLNGTTIEVAGFPTVNLLPSLCGTMDRIYSPYTSSGSFNWSRCGTDAKGIQSALSLGSFYLLPGKLPYNSAGARVPLSQGCFISSDSILSNRINVVVNGRAYFARLDGDANDTLSFNVPAPLVSPNRFIATISEPTSTTQPATSIRLEQSAGELEISRLTVFQNGVTVGSCFNPNAF
jgi:hypothetical protein